MPATPGAGQSSSISRLAIAGADGSVGRALLQRLQDGSIQTVALVRRELTLPASRVVAGPLRAEPAQAALRDADAVVHLAGALRPLGDNSYQAANVETAEAVARAIEQGRPQRIVLLSYLGADERSGNAYLRTKATAERVLRATGKPVVVLRCGYIIGPPEAPGPSARGFMAEPGKRPRVIGNGRQVVAPIYLGDVVDAVLAALEHPDVGIYDLAGPDRMPLDELVRLLNRDPAVKITHVPVWVARLLSLVVPELPTALVDTLARDSVGDASAAVRTFGLQLHSLRTVWATTADQLQPVTSTNRSTSPG